jgi:hypothetical protein
MELGSRERMGKKKRKSRRRWTWSGMGRKAAAMGKDLLAATERWRRQWRETPRISRAVFWERSLE